MREVSINLSAVSRKICESNFLRRLRRRMNDMISLERAFVNQRADAALRFSNRFPFALLE